MFGENIKSIRESKGIGVNELSRLSGVNASYISALERNEKKNPSVEILTKLANALEITLEDIIKDTYCDEVALTTADNNYEFKSAQEAMKFILEQPVVMGYGGFDVKKLSDKDLIDFANDLLIQLKNLGYKYKR